MSIVTWRNPAEPSTTRTSACRFPPQVVARTLRPGSGREAEDKPWWPLLRARFASIEYISSDETEGRGMVDWFYLVLRKSLRNSTTVFSPFTQVSLRTRARFGRWDLSTANIFRAKEFFKHADIPYLSFNISVSEDFSRRHILYLNMQKHEKM